MTYKSASAWADNNVSKEDFTNFEDWYNFVVNEHFAGVDIDKTGEFKQLMKEYWLEEMGVLDLEPEPEPPEPEPKEDIDIEREELEAEIERTNKPVKQEIQYQREQVFGVKEVVIPQEKGRTIIQKKEILPSGEERITMVRPAEFIPKPTPTVQVTKKPSFLERIRGRLSSLFRRKKE